MINQIEIQLPAYPRGYHLITPFIKQKLSTLPETGILNLFIQHTSAALTINENSDYSVRDDFEIIMNKLIPENEPYYTHNSEGADDMPAHIKASLFGQSVTIPISKHQINLGMWQGIYLCEFRNSGKQRNIVATIYQ